MPLSNQQLLFQCPFRNHNYVSNELKPFIIGRITKMSGLSLSVFRFHKTTSVFHKLMHTFISGCMPDSAHGNWFSHMTSFTARPHCLQGRAPYQSRQFRLSVRTSVTRWYCIPRRMKIGSHRLHYEVAKTLQFSETKTGWERRPLPPKIWAQTDPLPSEKRRLRSISAYNVATVRASEKVQLSQIGSRSRAFQKAIGEVRTSPLSPQRVAQKANVSFL